MADAQVNRKRSSAQNWLWAILLVFGLIVVALFVLGGWDDRRDSDVHISPATGGGNTGT